MFRVSEISVSVTIVPFVSFLQVYAPGLRLSVSRFVEHFLCRPDSQSLRTQVFGLSLFVNASHFSIQLSVRLSSPWCNNSQSFVVVEKNNFSGRFLRLLFAMTM